MFDFIKAFWGRRKVNNDIGLRETVSEPDENVGIFERMQQAAKQGDILAQYKLGGMYRYGDGVPKDSAKAIEWLLSAAMERHLDAQKMLAMMYVKGEGVRKDSFKAVELWDIAAPKEMLNRKASLEACITLVKGRSKI